jgi:hypothetical protein
MPVPGQNPRSKPAQGKLEFLTASGTPDTLSFPSDIGNLDHYVYFRISKDNKFKRDEVSRRDAQKTIILPMPSNLATAYNAQYSAEALGPAAGAAASVGAAARTGDGQNFAASLVAAFSTEGEDGKESFAKGLANIGTLAAEQEAGAIIGGLAGGLGGAALGAAASGALQAGLAGAGVARNPHLATLFTGVNFREHSFQYKFVPRSQAESDALREIIYAFKYHMAPDYDGSGHFFLYPEQFDIEFKNKDYLFDIGASVLTAFSVNYTGEGASFFFTETGAPVSVSINMSFQELTVNTKTNIKRDGGGR